MAEMDIKKDLIHDPEVLAAFQEYDRTVRIQTVKLFSWLIITLVPAGITLDYFVYPSKILLFLKARFICSALATVILLLMYTPFGRRYYRFLGFILPFLPAFFISWMIYDTEGVNSTYYAGLNLVLLAVGMICPWTYFENLMEGLIILASYVMACLLHPGPLLENVGILFNNLYFISLTQIIIVASSFSHRQTRIREFALRFEVDRSRKQLEETNRKLVELDQMKSEFFANINHELRTPLTLLLAPLEELQRQSFPDPKIQETLNLMHGNAMRLLKLINDLLDLVKLESKRMEVRKEPLRVDQFIKGITFSLQAAARDKKVQLSCRIEESLGVILADRDKLEKIILNLLFNSVKFTPAGGRIELTAITEGETLALRVVDTGMGISEGNLPHIFDRFWQADSSAQRKYQGTGIGLALVKELAEVQGGSVTAESRLGQGTTMTVKIPLEKTTEIPAPTEEGGVSAVKIQSSDWLEKLYRRAELFPAMTPVRATLRRDDFSKSKKPKVLVADDEPDMLAFLKSQLSGHYEILEAVDGNQAAEKARHFLPDLIILDMMMPEKDGITACGEIKAFTATQAIPIILLTARADEKTKMAALNAGANDFLTKPFSTTELHVRVKNLVESHQFQADLAREKTALESALEQLKETEGQLVQNEKMASLGRLSAGIIHEINNPLNYATQALHLLKTRKDRLPEEDRGKFVEVVSDIEEGVGRVHRIVSDLRSFTHPHSTGKDLVPLQEVISTSLKFLSYELKDRVQVDIQVPQDQTVTADRNKLVQVFVNLIQNSADALKEKVWKEEKPLILIKSHADDGRVRVSLRDNGTGIAPENMDKIFDPFFTTKDVGQGMGLGLSICYKIVREQGGEISVKSEKGQFTEIVLELPSKA